MAEWLAVPGQSALQINNQRSHSIKSNVLQRGHGRRHNIVVPYRETGAGKKKERRIMFCGGEFHRSVGATLVGH
jgi:hypothetical protein